MNQHHNPILKDRGPPAVDLTSFDAANVHRRPRSAKREIRDVRRAETAAAAIGKLTSDVDIYGFTKGQFSVIDIINHVLDEIGPARLDISTWTAANSDVTTVLEMVNAGRITASRWLVDLTFNRRSPQLAQRIRNVFGDDAIRVAKNHAKFVLLGNDAWKVVVRTSMNLNFNPRFENFQLGHDPELYDFHAAIFTEIWTKQRRTVQDAARPYDIHRHFNQDL
jgi:hypothetical protein